MNGCIKVNGKPLLRGAYIQCDSKTGKCSIQTEDGTFYTMDLKKMSCWQAFSVGLGSQADRLRECDISA